MGISNVIVLFKTGTPRDLVHRSEMKERIREVLNLVAPDEVEIDSNGVGRIIERITCTEEEAQSRKVCIEKKLRDILGFEITESDVLSANDEDEKKPSKLYLYRKWCCHTKDIIENNCLWLSHPQDFNDPFDCRIPTYKSNWDIENFYYKDIGIRCFSAANDNVLMWSHYADSHKGVCLEFDYDKLLAIGQAEIIKVRYRNRIPDDTGDKSIDLKRALSYKAMDWSYEREYRLMHGKSKNRKFDILPEALTGIFMGCEMCGEDKENIKKLVKRTGRDIPLFEMQKSPVEFKLLTAEVKSA